MQKDDIIRIAREAGWPDSLVAPIIMAKLAEFAALVAAAEREACAKVVEEADLVEYEHCMVLHTDGHATLRNAAAAIRARSNT